MSTGRLLLLGSLALLPARPAVGGVLAGDGAQGIRGKDITVCFVGDAPTTRAAFINTIRGYLQEHRGVASIDYEFLPSCPAPTLDRDGNEVYSGDLRVVLAGTSEPYSPTATPTGIRVPGIGCTRPVPTVVDNNGVPVLNPAGNQMDTNSSFGIFPAGRTPENDAHCRWNMRLGNDGDTTGTPWRNHTLHEFGHSLGFAHEFDRPDARAGATAAGCDTTTAATNWINGLPATGAGNSLVTRESYDVRSTMNYTVPACAGYVGNYSHAGLGALEQLSLHFMYPEDERVAEFLGRTVLKAGETLALQGVSEARGASATNHRMITTYAWTFGPVAGSTPSFTAPVTATGDFPLTLTYTDYAGRQYRADAVVRVLTAQVFDRTIAGPLPAQLLLLGP